MRETNRQRQRRIDSENAACTRVAGHLRDFGYPDGAPMTPYAHLADKTEKRRDRGAIARAALRGTKGGE